MGTVKGFNATKGYGFIQPDDGGNDVFVHISDVERAGLGTLREGQKISYDIVAARRFGKSFADHLPATGYKITPGLHRELPPDKMKGRAARAAFPFSPFIISRDDKRLGEF